MHIIVLDYDIGSGFLFGTINLKKLITSLIIPLGVGFLSSILTKNSMDIYGQINQPPLAPPGSVFPIVWTILFVLMGISLYLVRTTKGDQTIKNRGYIFYGLQLLFNFLWSIAFFNLRLYCFTAFWLGALIILIAINIYYFSKINKVAGWLLVPYILWCAFALYLNIGICILN